MECSSTLQAILRFSAQEAERLGNDEIYPDHFILGILRHGKNNAVNLLSQCNVNLERLRNAINQRFMQDTSMTHNVPLSKSANKVMNLLPIEAISSNAASPDAEHLLLSILREGKSFSAQWLKDECGVTYESMLQYVPHLRNVETFELPPDLAKLASSILGKLVSIKINGGEMMHIAPNPTPLNETDDTSSSNANPNQLEILKYGIDLTEKALQSSAQPIIGRTEEIHRLVEILCRKKKNNPILIGDPGVGKTAVIEGLAYQMVHRSIPFLRGKKLISLNMASLVAGTSYRGQFEQRMQNIISEMQSHPDIILFIDEIHTLVGAGNSRGSLDAANILKPALARGEIQCIGATTIEEYRKHIEKDGALARRFQSISILPPTIAQTEKILRKLSTYYASYHNVSYTREAIQACISLSQRYLTDRVLPDKAIDVMDEAGSAVKVFMKNDSSTPLVVTEDDIAHTISVMTGIPVEKISLEENQLLLTLLPKLLNAVKGQDDAVRKVVRAIQRSRLGLRDPNRPIGTFFFLGSTGVGKTYLAQCLAEQLFGSKDALIRFDMSEFSEKHTVSMLVGAPPGYEAHEDGGKLTEAVRRKPYSIVLFDEIEKAHPDIFQVLLQLLDEGRLTDRLGHQTDFRNTIVVLTSNVGTRQLRDFGAGIGFQAEELSQERTNETLMRALSKNFQPEFVNRIDDVVIFNALDKDTLHQIVSIEVSHLQQRLKAHHCRLSVSEAVLDQILQLSYDPKNGARPIKRAIQTYLEDEIADILLSNPGKRSITINQLHIAQNELAKNAQKSSHKSSTQNVQKSPQVTSLQVSSEVSLEEYKI